MNTPMEPNGNASLSSSKRKAINNPGSTRIKIPKRDQAKPVKAKRVQFWDKHSPLPMSRDEIRKNFKHAAIRFGQLEKYELLYTYDNIEPTEMRLLVVRPAKNRDMDLRVSLHTISDVEVGPDPLQEYEALSYHWGPGPAEFPVYLHGGKSLPKIKIGDLAHLRAMVPDCEKGQRFYVRPNLDKALRHLRNQVDPVVLWVDAVCINQKDEEIEKPAQIAKMKNIYHNAVNVCIWLGDGKGDSKTDNSQDFQAAMKFSQKILNLKELEKLAEDTNAAKSWSDLLDLMRCSWFSRRWVIQELALAREATVHCGNIHVPWQEFADAIGLFALNFDRVRALFRQSKDDKIFQNYKNFNELEPLGAKVLVDAITNTFRRSVDESIFEPVSDLETLVSGLSFFESSDPRDSIFALLNIASESLLADNFLKNGASPPKPDYKKNILAVYTDFLEWVFAQTGSLDMICRPWAIPEREKPGGRKNLTPLIALPSWIRTISGSPWGFQEQGFNGRLNGDSIVGRAGRRRYNASHGRMPEVQFGERPKFVPDRMTLNRVNSVSERNLLRAPDLASGPGANDWTGPAHRLTVKGMEIGSVMWTYGPVSRAVITKECLAKGGWDKGKDLARVPDKLWRTLVADRTSEGENVPPWYHRAALHCMALADNNGDVAIRELLDHGNTVDGKLPPVVTEYMKRALAVTWNRRFLEGKIEATDLEPLFGIGPPETVDNDRICILFGCSVPCILRPSVCEDGTEYFRFMGEAYIYGKMDGEAIATLGVEALHAKTKEFMIM